MAVLVLFFSLPPRFFSVLFSIFPFSIFSTLLFFQFSLVLCLLRYNRSVTVQSLCPCPRPAPHRANTREECRIGPGNGLDMFIDILKCRSPVFGCIVSYWESREGERERERERERESCVYTATINYTIMLDAGLFWGI